MEDESFHFHNNSSNHDSRSFGEGSNQIVGTRTPKNLPCQKNLAKIVTQNVQGLSETDLGTIINQMKIHDWRAVCIQETWTLGNESYITTEGYQVFFHNSIEKKINKKGILEEESLEEWLQYSAQILLQRINGQDHLNQLLLRMVQCQAALLEYL